MILAPRVVLAFALIVLAIAAQPAMCADCPRSCLRTADTIELCSPAAALDTTLDFFGVCHSRVAYDIPRAQLSAYTGGTFNCRANTSIEDDFAVFGPPAGTPLSFTAKLAVSAISGDYVPYGYATTIAWIWPEPADTVAWRWNACKDSQHWDRRDTVLSTPVFAVAELPFRMNFWLLAGASGRIDTSDMCASAWATFWFEDLPAGARVTSCHGYAQESVRARPTIWGKMTAFHR